MPAETTPVPGGRSERLRQRLQEQTWEIELLLSGALLFAVVRLPAAVDALYLRLEPGLSGSLDVAAFGAWYYLKLILYTLVASLVVHLVSRAYWVGLVGLDSVFPEGVQWDRAISGPILRRYFRERLPSLPAMERSANTVSSVIFAFAFGIVALLLLSVTLAAVVGGAAIGISRLFFDGDHQGLILGVLLALVLVPIVGANLTDQLIGKRLAPDGRAARLLRRVASVAYQLQGGALYSAIFLTLTSNLPRRIVRPVMALAFAGLIAFFLVYDVMIPRGRMRVVSSSYLPVGSAEMAVSPRYYEDGRGRDAIESSRLPSIQSDMIRDRYVRLFLPLDVDDVDEAVEEACPEAPRLADPGLRVSRRPQPAAAVEDQRAVLDCLGGLWSVTLNGRALTDTTYHFISRLDDGQRGLVTYLPVRGLPRGSNLLEVVAPAKPGRDYDEPRESHFIRFWR